MKKKILFIQPFYFFNGHYFGLFNNLVNNLSKNKNISFLVSENNKIKNFFFKKGLKNIKKKAEVFTFQSVKKSNSRWNALKAFFKVLKLNKKFDIFFFYDSDLFILSILYLFFWPFLINKKIIVYIFCGPESLDKSNFKRMIIKIFLSFKNNKIFTRTQYLAQAWQKYFSNKKNISYLGCYDFPDLNFNRSIRKGKLKCGVIGQVRVGKSIEFLYDFFQKNKKKGLFFVMGNFTAEKVKNNFRFLDKRSLFTENFDSSKKISHNSSSLDYICLMYDNFFDHRQDISTLYLAAKLRSPVICFNRKGWLLEKVKKYNCGLVLDSIKDLKNLPLRNSSKYKKFVNGMIKFDHNETGKIKENFFYNKIYNN